MNPLNNKGIALVTSLMLTLITLVIIMGIMFLVTNNMKSSGANQAYRSATEAAFGGADLLVQDVIPRLFANASTGQTTLAQRTLGFPNSNLASDYFGGTKLNMAFNSNACIQQKLNSAVSGWTACTGDRVNPKISPDVKFSLAGLTAAQGYTVYSKIIDTIPGVPYLPTPPGGGLIGGGVAESSGGTTTNLSHFIYRVEITGERTNNPSEKSNISVLYEY